MGEASWKGQQLVMQMLSRWGDLCLEAGAGHSLRWEHQPQGQDGHLV